jgi:large subunit ribosomal protein L25
MADLKLEAQSRNITGRKVKRLRAQGLVPVVVYGNAQAPENIAVRAMAFEKVLSSGGVSQLVEVDIEGVGTRNVLIREIQRHPVQHTLMHADFYAVNMTEKQQVHVPVVAVGRRANLGVEVVLVQALDHLEIEALPADIPAHIEVDISRLTSLEDDPITVGELPKIDGITYLNSEDETIFSLVMTRAAVEEEEEEEEELEAEPEVIGRGREDEDEE